MKPLVLCFCFALLAGCGSAGNAPAADASAAAPNAAFFDITIDGVPYELHEGESIVMPAGHPHAVYGKEQFKMLLVVVF